MTKSREKQLAQIYYFDKKTKQKKSRNTVVKRTFQFIPRANDLSKEISVKAANLMETIDSMFKKDEVIYVTHDFLSSITRVDARQNNNLLSQLTHIIDVKYRRSVIHKNKKLHEVLEIKRTQNGKEIIENPEVFFSKKDTDNQEKNYSDNGKKLPPRKKKITGPIYKEVDSIVEVEEIAFGYISSTKEENKIKEESIEPSSLATSSLAELASELVLHQTGEDRTEANTFPNQPTTKSVVIPMRSAEEKEHYASHRHRDSGSGLKAIHELSVITNLLITPVPEEYPTETSVLDSYATTEIIEAEIIPEEEVTPMGIQIKPTSSKLWQEVREKMMNSYEEEVDQWDIKWIFNELEIEENLERKILVFKGSGYVIDTLKNKKGNHWKRFTTSFYEVMPDYSFEFVEAQNAVITEDVQIMKNKQNLQKQTEGFDEIQEKANSG